MADPFDGYRPGLTSPGRSAFAITPGASVLAIIPRSLYVGGAGNVEVEGADGVVVVFTAVPAGSILPFGPQKVLATNTTASLILGLY